MNFINNKWIDGLDANFASLNPANQEKIWQGKEANKEQVDLAVASAREAFESWSDLSFDERKVYLEKFTDELKNNRSELAELIAQETGKPLWESNMEVGGMIGKLAIAIEAFQERTGIVSKEIKSGSSVTRHKAHGVIAVFGPFNFPGHIANGHIIPALLAGNTVVFKPSEQTPACTEKIFQLWQASAIPAGVINLVQGGPKTGAALSSNTDIDGLFFTGSSKTGTLLHKQFAGQPEKILALEMGGNNPLIVHEVSDLEAAAYITIQSSFITAGQRCVCARRLIVPEGKEGDSFIELLEERIKDIVVGPYDSEPEPFMGSLISHEAANAVLASQEDLIKHGAKVLIKSKLLKEDTGLVSPGLIDSSNIKREDKEIFGPILQIIRVKDFDQAIQEANNTSYGLSAGLISDNQELYERFFKKAKAGIINWNQQLTGASSAAPFGGVGISGNHRPSAYYAADYCAFPIASLESSKAKMPEKSSPGLKITNKNP